MNVLSYFILQVWKLNRVGAGQYTSHFYHVFEWCRKMLVVYVCPEDKNSSPTGRLTAFLLHLNAFSVYFLIIMEADLKHHHCLLTINTQDILIDFTDPYHF